MMRTSNPALRGDVFSNPQLRSLSRTDAVMTVQGAINKSFILLGLLFLSAFYSWGKAFESLQFTQTFPTAYVWGGALGGLVVALVTVFKKNWSPFTAPLYAVLEGLFLGALSMGFELQYPGIATQAVLGTFGVFAIMLFLYRSKIIQPTEKFKLGIVAATGGIFFIYLISMIMGFFGVSIPYIHESGLIGIGFSVFVVIIAALNLILDFDLIEQGSRAGAPKFMEWYGAFALLVTLVWLYLEILRLLAKARGRR